MSDDVLMNDRGNGKHVAFLQGFNGRYGTRYYDVDVRGRTGYVCLATHSRCVSSSYVEVVTRHGGELWSSLQG